MAFVSCLNGMRQRLLDPVKWINASNISGDIALGDKARHHFIGCLDFLRATRRVLESPKNTHKV